jgi:glyoxylase-like metal-dependent hydrolase (beta-lactamase superfamily II)
MKPYKIYTLHYAKRDATADEYLLGEAANTPLEVAYYLWVATNGEETVVIDLGYNEQVGRRRGRTLLYHPAELLDRIQVNPNTVQHAIVTHMHWDHVGCYALFPNTRFYLQERELHFWTSTNMAKWQSSLEEDELVAMVRLHFRGRLGLCNGTQEIVPGITVHHVGGHTMGLQIVQVETAQGTAVVASDATKLYRNVAEDIPQPQSHNMSDLMNGFKVIRRLAAKEDLILPGHDPAVMHKLSLYADGVALLE